MRTIALSATVCGLVVAVAGITVGNDLEMLLEDLSFGDETSAVVKEAEAFQPDDSGFFMPGSAPPKIAMQQEPDAGELTLGEGEEGDIDFEAAFQTQEQGAAAAAIVPPVEGDADETLVHAEGPAPLRDNAPQGSLSDPAMIDGDNPMPAPMTDAPSAAMPISTHAAPIVNPHFEGHHGTAGCNSCGSNAHYGGVIECRPHVKPNLPTSTFYQYFGSDPCYTNVWDGYHLKCPTCKHLNGTCDCFHKSHCGKCDSCDR